MLTLTIRTDKPEAEIGLFRDNQKLAYETWQAHRQLAETIHHKLTALLESQNLQLQDLEAIVAFQGPGSFTGLRIGLSVANALAYSLDLPIVAAQGDGWITAATAELQKGAGQAVALPEYGALPNITPPKK